MFRSMFRFTAASVLASSLLLATVPAQAQPRDPDSRLITADASWLAAALGWVEGLLGGSREGEGHAVPMTSSCIDPQGSPVAPCIDNR